MVARMTGWQAGVGAFLAGLALWTSGARGQGVDTSASDVAMARSLSRAFQGVAKKAEPAVVHITQYNRVLVRENFSLSERAIQTGLGSGVVVSPDGVVLTNNHVAENAEELLVRLTDGREFKARIVGRDKLTDVAVLKIDATGLPYAEFADSDALEVGEWVVAIGSPFGFSNTVTSGIVSAFGRSLTPAEENPYQDFIQTDAAINPGNSGGPLLNLDGKIVGINTAIASRSGGYQGLGFAIPSNMAKAAMENILRHGRVLRGWLGVEYKDAAGTNGTAGAEGVLVTSVVPGSPAEAAGVRPGDVIRRIQGRPMNEARLRNFIALTPPGDSLTLDLVREGKGLEVSARVEDRGTMIARALGATYVKSIGANVRAYTKEQAQRETRLRFEGAQVVAVDAGGVAERSGLAPGDVVVRVGRRNVTDATEFVKEIERSDLSEGVVLQVVRGRMQGQIVLKGE